MPQSSSMATGMEDAWRLEVHLLNSIRGVKRLNPDSLWELGLAHGHCGNKII